MSEEPTPEDWRVVGEDLRKVMNDFAMSFGTPLIPAPTGPPRNPTDAELAAYDAVVPGASKTLRDAAALQMRHRQRLEKRYGLRSQSPA